MPLDETLLAELKQTKAEIDRLQTQLKDLVARLQEGGATTQEIAQALRG
jgi:Skp family chaperone for outer membrane proteins